MNMGVKNNRELKIIFHKFLFYLKDFDAFKILAKKFHANIA